MTLRPTDPSGDPPIDAPTEAANLTVASAARLLGVHANTVRTWTDQGRLRCFRINARGDRRYRRADLLAFLAAAGLDDGEAANGALGRHGSAGRSPDPGAAIPRGGDAPDRETVARPRSLALLREISRLLAGATSLQESCREVARLVRATLGYRGVAVAERRDGRMRDVAADRAGRTQVPLPLDEQLVEVALRERRPILAAPGRSPSESPSEADASPERIPMLQVIVPVGLPGTPWGVLLVEDASERGPGYEELHLLETVADQVAVAADRIAVTEECARRRTQTETLRLISTELASPTDPVVTVERVVDLAMTLFGAQRAQVSRRGPDGLRHAVLSRGLSERYLEAVRLAQSLPFGDLARAGSQPVVAVDFGHDPRAASLREAVLGEGYDTIALAPLLAGDESVGVLALYHDERHDWKAEELDVLEVLAAQAAVALKSADNYAQMATWAAQLQAIQQLGTRINGLTSVVGIGQAIASQLNQLIDYHNVRVYRVDGDDVEPIAWRGEIGEYDDEDGDRLRLKVGEGITGWVAQHGIAQILADAAADPRAETIPGTEDDLDESMLLAPMLYEGGVIGVIVLSKLGLHQFTDDDLRLLEIFASIAAQALVNADASERLRAQSEALARQLAGQRELLRVTESILGTLEPGDVMEEIAERLGALIRVDSLSIDLYDRSAGILRPLFARGDPSTRHISGPIAETDGVRGWVVRNGEPQLVPDTTADERIVSLGSGERPPGALIVAPLRGHDSIIGVLVLERTGREASFTDEEFELIKLFAGHVSIALQNAQTHEATEIKARTDALTGLENQGALHDRLARAVARGAPFSLLLLDLDRFKAFNDRRGHQAGNLLLKGIARALEGSVREADVVFRYGGDEFAILLPNTTEEGAVTVAEKVRHAVRHVPAPGTRRHDTGVTCSIGVAAFPADSADRDGILLAADRACYVAKRAGRDRVATGPEGLSLAGEFLPPPPTPVDEQSETAPAA